MSKTYTVPKFGTTVELKRTLREIDLIQRSNPLNMSAEMKRRAILRELVELHK